MRRERNLGFLARYISSLLIGIVLVGGGFLVYFGAISPFIINSPWSFQLLTIESIVLPLAILSIYPPRADSGTSLCFSRTIARAKGLIVYGTRYGATDSTLAAR